jgi:Protein of unknown function (DUF3800)
VCPKSQIDILASLAHPRTGKRRDIFVMLECYLDESGIHAGAKVCVVAGFYGTQHAWRKFENQWKRIISNHPELTDGFHAKPFFRRENGKRVGVYENWSDEKARNFQSRLVQVITSNRVFPIGFGVVVKDFLDLPLHSRQWFTGGRFRKSDGAYAGFGSPEKSYYLPFQFCVLGASALCKTPETKIHFAVGLDRTFYGYAGELFKTLIEDERIPDSLRSRLGTIVNPLSKDTPGIQAADLLSYRMYRHASEKADNHFLPTPPLLMTLIKRQRPNQAFTLFDTKAILRMENRAREDYIRVASRGK